MSQPNNSLTIYLFQEKIRGYRLQDELCIFACFLEDYIFKIQYVVRNNIHKVRTHIEFMHYLLQIVVYYLNHPESEMDFASSIVVADLKQEYVIGGILNIILRGYEKLGHMYTLN